MVDDNVGKLTLKLWFFNRSLNYYWLKFYSLKNYTACIENYNFYVSVYEEGADIIVQNRISACLEG